jgi:hypothetical protein
LILAQKIVGLHLFTKAWELAVLGILFLDYFHAFIIG